MNLLPMGNIVRAKRRPVYFGGSLLEKNNERTTEKGKPMKQTNEVLAHHLRNLDERNAELRAQTDRFCQVNDSLELWLKLEPERRAMRWHRDVLLSRSARGV